MSVEHLDYIKKKQEKSISEFEKLYMANGTGMFKDIDLEHVRSIIKNVKAGRKNW